jgi:hypothetical protein
MNLEYAFPKPNSLDANGNTQWGFDGLTSRLYCAVEIYKTLLAVRPYEVMARAELANEAFKHADALMSVQFKETT